jgi:hypothetical protein
MTPNKSRIWPSITTIGLLLLQGAIPALSFGEEQRYITDEILVPVRSGAGVSTASSIKGCRQAHPSPNSASLKTAFGQRLKPGAVLEAGCEHSTFR